MELAMTPKGPTFEREQTDKAWADRVKSIDSESYRLGQVSKSNDIVSTDHARNFNEVQAWLSLNQGEWIYRGQTDSNWGLMTSIDRAKTVRWRDQTGRMKSFQESPQAAEDQLLLRFQQRAHHYVDVPAREELLDWLALMQHYGTPTRLLDWTKSPYVGLYFAVESTLDSQNEEHGHALWAMATDWLESAFQGTLRNQQPSLTTRLDFQARYENISGWLATPAIERRVVVLAHPLRMNERLAAQQGMFLANVSQCEAFNITLLRTLELTGMPSSPMIRKLIIAPNARTAVLRELYRMNITGASLFPGLDGFSRSLRINLELELSESLMGDRI